MTDLPITVESYLQESGFSATEILVLKKLIEGEALTVREIAGKTGKGTGMLDRAVKKLLRRGILVRESVNERVKFAVKSLDAVNQWMKNEMELKRKLLERREQDFDAFIKSISLESSRPDMEYFDGEEGIKKAYMRLLELADKELLFYVPVSGKEEDDPLRAFRVQHFRERHSRGIFSRVIAPDTPLGRRYKSRDAFEYRKTVLVPENEFPSAFEKAIAGSAVMCFNHAKNSASLIRYPEMAQSEHAMFNAVWKRGEREEKVSDEQIDLSIKNELTSDVKILSASREFFLSRKSIVLFAICALISATVSYGLYRQNMYINLQRVRERVTAIAATAAPEFDANDLDELHTWRDASKPAYSKVVKQLQALRSRNKGVEYAYIMRKTDNPYYYEFVADADSLDFRSWNDVSGDGLRNDVLLPGYLFFDHDYDTEFSALHESLKTPIADKKPFTDPWGTWISGHAPIFDSKDAVIASLGVDIAADTVEKLSSKSFKFVFYFLGFFLLFIFIRLAAFNRSLFKDILSVINSKAVLVILIICSFVFLGVFL